MSVAQTYSATAVVKTDRKALALTCFALVVAQIVYLMTSVMNGTWLLQPDGLGIPSDFVNVWAAGKLALDGNSASAYNWILHKEMEVRAVGHEFDGYFGWHYPPPFLFAATALATLPYAGAYVLWTLATFPAYLVAIRGIVGSRDGIMLAAAFPAVLANFVVGQNGFLTAGLLGGFLLLLERRPVWSGVCLGLLTYKPHLGLIVPVVLAASGHWRVFFTAGAVAALMALASWLAFGTEAWTAFIGSIGHTSQAFLSDGWADWSKLQTAFGLVRTLGGSETLAWTLQAAVAVGCATAVTLLWRSRAPSGMKAAALAAGVLLATPYLYTYDLVVLAVPLAFVIRAGRTHGFLPHEMTGVGIAALLVLIFPLVTAPVGFAAVLVVAALIVRRIATPQA